MPSPARRYPDHLTELPHYAESFYFTFGERFRLIQAEDGSGHAQHCPGLPEWRGRFKDNAGRWHTVESCDGHRADLDSVQWIRNQ